jgi:hypothetical protein
MARPVASAIVHQCGPNNARNAKPTNELRKWPAITLRGCANGMSGYPNKSRHVAPNDPSTSVTDRELDRTAASARARHAPAAAIAITWYGGLGGNFSPAPLNLSINDVILFLYETYLLYHWPGNAVSVYYGIIMPQSEQRLTHSGGKMNVLFDVSTKFKYHKVYNPLNFEDME